jgi:hypothetical protein
VWLEANRLVVYNGDLAGRITSIPADTWSAEELAPSCAPVSPC